MVIHQIEGLQSVSFDSAVLYFVCLNLFVLRKDIRATMQLVLRSMAAQDTESIYCNLQRGNLKWCNAQ